MAPRPATGKTPVRGIRVADDLWARAQTAAEARGEYLPDVIRAFLARYARSAPKQPPTDIPGEGQ